jgi:hypothetical protein
MRTPDRLPNVPFDRCLFSSSPVFQAGAVVANDLVIARVVPVTIFMFRPQNSVLSTVLPATFTIMAVGRGFLSKGICN